MIDSREIGRRVAYWRKRRGMSRERFAVLVGRSVSWAKKIEKGQRELVRLPMLERVAGALQIRLSVLIDETEAEQARSLPDATEVTAIKSALGRYEQVTGTSPTRDVPDLERLCRQVDYVHEAFLASDFAVVGRTLPELIVEGQRAATQSCGATERRAAALLVRIYKTASSTLHKFGAHELAWLTADRALNAAAVADDPVSLARGARCAARALMSVGQRKEALELLVETNGRLESQLDDASPELVALDGMLWLAAEIAAAREGDSQTALEMHHQAEAVAHRLGPGHDDHSTAFGITNVLLHRMAALVRLGDGPAALRHAETVDHAALDRLPRERKANYLMDLAAAHRQCGNAKEAIAVLWKADQIAPQEIRGRPLAREMIAGIWEANTDLQGSTHLRHLARHVGLPV